MPNIFDKTLEHEDSFPPKRRKVYTLEEIGKNFNLRAVNSMNERMNQIESQFDSGSFCTAKWLQSTIYLMSGNNHSCHHPPVHKISIDKLFENPSALHNTDFKKSQRQMMLDRKRPEECQYCWNIENLDSSYTSDRVYKSTDLNWSVDYVDRINKIDPYADVNPTYLEVAFDSTCNLKCMYCTPDISSKWMEEIEQHGPYPGRHNDVQYIKNAGKMPIPNNKFNPYVDAFWRWWPSLVADLRTFRITGGEPLLSKNTWRVFDDIIANPRPDLELAINSNFDVPEQLFKKFLDTIPSLLKNVKSFTVYTSGESHGEQCEYVRFGMNYNRWLKNAKEFLSVTPPEVRLGIMTTFNALSLTTFEAFLNDIYNLRVEFNETASHNRVPMMFNYLRWPEFQNARILPTEFKRGYIDNIKKFVIDHSRSAGEGVAGRFYLEEIDQVNRLEEYIMQENNNDKRVNMLRKQFGAFYREYDRRRGTDFAKVFPNMVEFYNWGTDAKEAK